MCLNTATQTVWYRSTALFVCTALCWVKKCLMLLVGAGGNWAPHVHCCVVIFDVGSLMARCCLYSCKFVPFVSTCALCSCDDWSSWQIPNCLFVLHPLKLYLWLVPAADGCLHDDNVWFRGELCNDLLCDSHPSSSQSFRVSHVHVSLNDPLSFSTNAGLAICRCVVCYVSVHHMMCTGFAILIALKT